MSEARTGKLTTHVLDVAHGRPAAGLRIQLYWLEGGNETLLRPATTGETGRPDEPLLEGRRFSAGTYKLAFHVGDYFEHAGHADARRFLDVVPVVFTVDDATANYHVPLVVSPWAYSTYRGS